VKARFAKTITIAALLVAACSRAQAAGFSFDAPSAPLAAAYEFAAPAAVPAPVLAPRAGALRAYDFKTLWKTLGYPALQGRDEVQAVAHFGATEDEVLDLTSYTSKHDPFYQEVNGYLRYYPAPYDWSGTSPEDARVMVKNIDKVFTRVPEVPADLALFRGLDLGFRDSRPYAVGEEFVDKGYVSTSVSYKVARHFAIGMNACQDEPSTSRKAIFVLYLTRPEKGILIDQGEDEVILDHGRKFRVMAKVDAIRQYDLYLVQVCAAVCDTTLRAAAASFWNNLSLLD